ncbi:MAG: response regulator transcription factor [Elusimicrobia bacterium]|nr:response regulator transcription factor [Elusimicrobiota bacterium]
MYRILIAEDDVMMQRVLKDTLKPEGFEVMLHADGESALAAAAQDKPDLIVLDMNLPGLSGLEVCRKLKAEASTRHIPVLVLTGEARETDMRVASLDAGAEDYLFKPLGGKALLARIRAALKIAVKPV